MKKLITLILISLYVPSVLAATISSDGEMRLRQNELRAIGSITIMAEDDDEINTENGINLLLDSDKRILWHKSAITISGSGVDNDRVSSQFIPTYPNDYKVLHIPVNSNFLAGEQITIEGLALRAYDREFTPRHIGLDLNGNYEPEISDTYSYRVLADSMQDVIPPYPITDFEYSLNDKNTELILTWNNPPDYDLKDVYIEETLNRGGDEIVKEPLTLGNLTEIYTFFDLLGGDEMIFKIYPLDRYQTGDSLSLTVSIPIKGSEPVDEPVEEPVDEEPTTNEIELNALSRLFNYYTIRYNIKCMPSGIPASESSSTCLWARIDLVYAQELLERDDVDVNLSDRDIELMGKRLQYPEQRYEDNCVNSNIPASYCPALSKALQRVHYFVD